jgi:uncharacterized protein
MKLLDKIRTEAKEALKKGEVRRVETLRFLISLIEKKELSLEAGKMKEEDVLVVLQTEMKKKKESLEMFLKAKRKDLSDQIEKEIKVLSEYLPKEMSLEEIEKVVKKVREELGVEAAFGAVMGRVMKELKGAADGNKVAQVVKKQFLE